MNTIEKALMHALFLHLHHNIDKAIDFEAVDALNKQVSKIFPGALVVGPGDEAAVFQFPDTEGTFVAKMESHCSPCVPRPYDAAATGAGGAMRDVLAMGARPIFLLNFIGTRPLHEKVIVGPCGFEGKCTCGKCIEMTSNDGNDTHYREGLVEEMRPAVALFEEERKVMEATLAAFRTGKIKACSDLGAAGIGAAVCESARYGGFGARADLTNVPLKVASMTPEEILICETQGRMAVQAEEKDVDEVLATVRSKGVKAEMIAEITDDDKQVFEYQGKTIAVIPNRPSEEDLKELMRKD